MKRPLPKNLLSASQAKTHEAFDKLERAKAAIKDELASGALAKKHRKIDAIFVLTRAGLNKDFLKGDRHKQTTRPQVRDFVNEINSSLGTTRPDERKVMEELRAELSLWKEKYEELADVTNSWAIRLREARRENTRLKLQLSRIQSSEANNVVILKR